MFSQVLFTLIAASATLLGVQAQSSAASSAPALPTSIGNVSPCIIGCTSGAATQAGCSGVEDINCVCTSKTFQAQALSCLTANCTKTDQQIANGLQSGLCNGLSATNSSASSPAASATSPASNSTTSGKASNTPNAAAGLPVKLGTGLVVGLIGVVTGVVTGAGVLL